MKHINRRFIPGIAALLLSACIALPVAAESRTRDGEANITFVKLYYPEKVQQGQFYQIDAEMMALKNIWSSMTVFFHLVKEGTNEIVLNNDFAPSIPTTQWTAGSSMRVGPANAFIPYDMPAGTYSIRMGLFLTEQGADGAVKVDEPYTNTDIKDFTVGSLVVEPAPPEEAQKRDDLVISSFDNLVDIRKWQVRGAILTQVGTEGAGGGSVGKIVYPKGAPGCPSVLLESFFRYSDPKYSNWSAYDNLQFFLYCDPDEAGSAALRYPVILQVKDKAEKRFQSPLMNQSGKDKPVIVPITTIAKSIDTGDIGNLSFFIPGASPSENMIVYLDDIRLTSLGLDRDKGPSVTIEAVSLSKDRVKAGEDIQVQATLSTSRLFADDFALFIHVYPVLGGKQINADTTPIPPTTQWEPNKKYQQGPFTIFIPPQAPTGRYNISLGLFIMRQVPPGAKYAKYYREKSGVYNVEQPSYPNDSFRQPYVNYQEYGDWVIGSFEVTS